MTKADPGTILFDTPTELRSGSMSLEAALRYAEATFDQDPAYAAGRATPPLSSALLVLPSLADAFGTCMGDGAIVHTHGMHGEQDTTIHAPFAPGDEVVWDAVIHSVRQNTAGVLMTIRIEVRTPSGAPLTTHLWSTIFPKATTTCEGGPDLPDHQFPESARQHLLGREVLFIPDDHGETYYRASGDGAPHARFLEVAQREGHPGLILQGMGSLGIVTAAVVRLAGGGDSTRLERLAVRFSSPVLLGHDLEICVYEVTRDPGGSLEVAFEATQGERICLRHGRARFRPEEVS